MSTHAKWKNLESHHRRAAQTGLTGALEFLLDQANQDVPHDEGNLQRSGIVSVDTKEAKGCVSYDTPYAVRLHEHPEYNFQKNRKGKWLEDTWDSKGPKAVKYLQRAYLTEFR